MTTGFERRTDHSTFRSENPDLCKSILKDFVTSGGDWTSSDLSPAIRDDPQLQQQCRQWGYMIIQLGDQLRQVYCGSPVGGHTEQGADCPQCGQPFCVEHLSEHLGAKVVDPTSLQIGQPADPGQNPNPYLSAPPGVDQRSNMSTWDNRELERNQLAEMQAAHKKFMFQDLKEDREGNSLTKAMWRHIHKAEAKRFGSTWIQKNGQGGEHEMEPEQIMALDPVSRLVFEVWAYNDEYKAPASTADIAVELATRGIDEKFQEQLEEAAHAHENWLPAVLEQLASQGLIDKSPYGGWIPTTHVFNSTKGFVKHKLVGGKWVPTPGEGGEGSREPGIEEDMIPSGQRVTINAPKLAYHGEVGKILYSTQPPGATERNYIIEMGDGKKILRIGSQVTPEDPSKMVAMPKPVEAPTPAPGIPVGVRVPVEGPSTTTSPPGAGWVRNPLTGGWDRPKTGVEGYTGEVETEGWGKGYPKIGTTIWASSPYVGTFQGKIIEYSQGGNSGIPWVRIQGADGEINSFHGSNLSVEKPPDPISRSVPATSISSWISNALHTRAKSMGHELSDTQAPKAPKIEGLTITHWEPLKAGLRVHSAMYGTTTETVALGEKEVREAVSTHFTKEELDGIKLELHDNKTVTSISRSYGMGSRGGGVGFTLGGGFYINGDHRILIGRFTKYYLERKALPGHEPYAGGTVIHELEHHVYSKLTRTEQSEWERTYYNHNHGDIEKHVSSYGQRNSDEGWAECSREYKLYPEDLKKNMPDVYEVIDKLHKRVREHPELGPKGDY